MARVGVSFKGGGIWGGGGVVLHDISSLVGNVRISRVAFFRRKSVRVTAVRTINLIIKKA